MPTDVENGKFIFDKADSYAAFINRGRSIEYRCDLRGISLYELLYDFLKFLIDSQRKQCTCIGFIDKIIQMRKMSVRISIIANYFWYL